MKGIGVRCPCSVSHELVVMVSKTNPKFILKNGDIDINKVLYVLGFHIKDDMKNFGIIKTENVLVRDNYNPSFVYKTSCIYNGEVREIKYICRNSKNEVVFEGSKKHELSNVYEKYEILQPIEINKIIPLCDMINIVDVGSEDCYNNGFISMDKPKKNTTRNIVRN